MIINNLSLHRLNPSSFSSSPVCKLLSVWDDYGDFIVSFHQLAMPSQAGPSNINTEGPPHATLNLRQRKTWLKVHLLTPTSNVPVQRFSAETTYQNHHNP